MAAKPRVGFVGAGLMGHGIAQVAAQAGYEVVLREVDQGRLDKGIGRIEKQLAPWIDHRDIHHNRHNVPNVQRAATVCVKTWRVR